MGVSVLAWQKRGQREPCTHCTCPSSPPSILESDASPHHVGSVSVCDIEWGVTVAVRGCSLGQATDMGLYSLARGASRANTTACSVSARHRSPTHGQEQQCTRSNVLTRWQWFTGHSESSRAWCTEPLTSDIPPHTRRSFQLPQIHTTTVVAGMVVALSSMSTAQDTSPCESYDVTTGKGVCNGLKVNVGAVICIGGFNKETCKASRSDGNGGTETYYFRGTPTGLPVASDIQSDCDTADFPAAGGVAVGVFNRSCRQHCEPRFVCRPHLIVPVPFPWRGHSWRRRIKTRRESPAVAIQRPTYKARYWRTR
eukprot:m.214297 g.214297  ORF g.214297 m.214297 type:complete len:311 (+) comp25579_c0_seq5:2723-3655(+)